jgi:hypothetical protein
MGSCVALRDLLGPDFAIWAYTYNTVGRPVFVYLCTQSIRSVCRGFVPLIFLYPCHVRK